MYYPPYLTGDAIMEFEYEYNRYLDIERGEGQFWEVNAELQLAAAADAEESELVEVD